MDFSFFITDNKSGYKTTEKWLSKNYPEIYSKIINHIVESDNPIPFKERIWLYFNNLNSRPKCKNCNKEVKFRNRLDKPYGDFCDLSCFNSNKEEMINRQKKTFQKKYNVDFYPQHNEFVEKQQRTKLLKYGDKNYNNIKQGKETRSKKYGNENYNNSEKYIGTCLNKYGTTNYSMSTEYRTSVEIKFRSLYPNLEFESVGKNSVTLRCKKCGKISEMTKQLIYERNKRKYEVCPVCNPIGFNNRSNLEKEFCEFLSINNINYKTNEKIGDKKIEVDIYIPEMSIGVEINGLYWHNELFKNSDFHLNKSNYCLENNIELIHIFEDEWVYNKEIVKSIILNRVGKTTNKLYARNCEIKEIPSKVSKQFLEENHIQGNVNSKVRIGLYHKNELVSLMTFSKGRVLMGGKDTEWELNRFCNSIGVNVIGGASKLLKYFIKTNKPNKIVSYSDIRIFNGNMYKSLGFNYISKSKPNYWYVINGLRQHRFNFRKSILIKQGYDPKKTEKEIMFDLGKYRIYDCGNIRWEYNLINE